MPEKRRKSDYRPHIPEDQAPNCRAAGCGQPGTYKAPKSRHKLHEYDWYCLDHIREVNRKWDFFGQMERDEIETFMKDALTGHRPTWSRESQVKRRQYEQLEQAVHDFLHGQKKRQSGGRKSHLPQKLRQAMAVLDIEEPFSAASLKRQYRMLVKKYHPDLNKNDKMAEERFKEITAAYLILAGSLKES